MVTLSDGTSSASVTVVADVTGAWTLLGSEIDISLFDNGSISVTANATDAAGNSGPNATATITLDNVAPTGLVITSPIEGDNVVNASEDEDVLVAGTAESGSSVEVTVSDGTNSITQTVTADGSGAWTISGSGIDISTFDNGPITVTATETDTAGNTGPEVTASITLDNVSPGVTIEQGSGQTDPVLDLPLVFDVEFDSPVTGFAPADVTIGGTATFDGAPVITVTPVGVDGANYTVTVDGALTAPGTVTASVNANGADDSAGNGNTASTSVDNTITVTGRTVTLVANDSIPLESSDNTDLDLENNSQFEVTLSDVSSTDTLSLIHI